jgi:hypothetical protein
LKNISQYFFADEKMWIFSPELSFPVYLDYGVEEAVFCLKSEKIRLERAVCRLNPAFTAFMKVYAGATPKFPLC